MKSWASRAALAAGLAAAIALPVIGQEAPKSLLPEGFDEPPPAPAAPAAPVPGAETSVPQAPGAANGAPILPPGTAGAPAPLAPAIDPLLTAPKSRDIDFVGWLSPRAGGYGPNTFAGSNGKFIAGLLRRLDTPIASRWAHIVLRRALLSEVPTPADIRPADWVAERALALVRMGEVDGAKALVGRVSLDRYTPRLYAVAAQVHLAAGDVMGLCPMGPTAATISREPLWPLVNGLCAGLEGDDLSASVAFDGLRNSEAAHPFDIGLAERIATAASGTGRAANVEWADVDRLTVYRFGMATAGGVSLPENLVERTRAPVRAWMLRNPNVSLERRAAMAPAAAAIGVSSAAELVKLHAAYGAEMDPFAFDASISGRLRAAFVARTPDDRLAAMRTIWSRASGEQDRYAAKIMTARAAARLPVDEDQAEAAPDLIASALTAGYGPAALRWWPIVEEEGGKTSDLAWALLVLADSGNRVAATGNRFDDWYQGERSRVGEARAKRRAQLMAAALAGLGRGSEDWVEVMEDLGAAPLDNSWTRRIDAAANAGRIGAVATLAAVGLQGGMPPQHLRHILSAYRKVGRADEARMMAVEALTRS